MDPPPPLSPRPLPTASPVQSTSPSVTTATPSPTPTATASKTVDPDTVEAAAGSGSVPREGVRWRQGHRGSRDRGWPLGQSRRVSTARRRGRDRYRRDEGAIQGERLKGPEDQKRYRDAVNAYEKEDGSCSDVEDAPKAIAAALEKCASRSSDQEPVVRGSQGDEGLGFASRSDAAQQGWPCQ